MVPRQHSNELCDSFPNASQYMDQGFERGVNRSEITNIYFEHRMCKENISPKNVCKINDTHLSTLCGRKQRLLEARHCASVSATGPFSTSELDKPSEPGGRSLGFEKGRKLDLCEGHT